MDKHRREYPPDLAAPNVVPGDAPFDPLAQLVGCGWAAVDPESPRPYEFQGLRMIAELQTYLSGDSIRPLTDSVVVATPSPVNYSINLDYYINKEDSDIAESIQAAVSGAVSKYRKWQRSRIGRDIDPGYLQYLIYAAGAKRVVVHSPVFAALSETEIAYEETNPIINYKGLEPT